MKRILLLIMLIGLVLAGCRAKLETSSSRYSTSTDEIGLELRRFDSLWSSLSERLTFKIEYYPIDNGSSNTNPDNCVPIDPTATSVGRAPQPGAAGGGVGSVKSVEFTAEKTEDRSSITATDSTYNEKSADQDTLQKETSSEAKHDNGTVLILAIVGGLVVIGVVWLLLKKFFKK